MQIDRNSDNTFNVKTKNGKMYLVRLDPVSCTCPHFQYRNYRSGEFCKHIDYVTNEFGKLLR